jgi:hypothetical protein
MKRCSAVFLIIFICAKSIFGQEIPQKEIREFFTKATQARIQNHDIHSIPSKQNTDSTSSSSIFRVIEKLKTLGIQHMLEKPAGGDTLVIGMPPYDSLIVTGTYSHNGTIMVLGNGILRFRNANATIAGDLYVWGDHALVTADSSYLYFPQQYFYQRSLVIAGNGKVAYKNTTLDHSGLSNNLVLTDSAHIILNNVTNIGFTTCGMNKKSEIDINEINQAGEFVIQDQAKLNITHAQTILLWFQVPSNASFHYSFPDGDTVQSFTLNNATPGISGIEYTARVDTSTGVMWALMPVTGSNVDITDSKIRSIGLWFLGHDTIPVSGFVDNSQYIDFNANLTDRYLHLSNSSVLTWSLYPMDTVRLNVTGCILGEIGSEANCSVITTDAFVDGSGGYWWATDRTFMIGENCMAMNAIRSSQSAFFIFAYSSLNLGEADAMGNSIMMIVQSQLPGPPVLYDGSCIWYSFIGNSSSASIDTIVQIPGSAWIDKTPSSQLMGFGWYSMSWQKSGDTLWHPIGGRYYTEKRDDILASWDTHGFAPGLYYLKLILTDNTPDSSQNEAVSQINLLPTIFGIDEINPGKFNIRIFPDPVNENSVIEFSLSEIEPLEISVTDISGKILFRVEQRFGEGRNLFSLGKLDLPPGSYYCIIRSKDHYEVANFVKE